MSRGRARRSSWHNVPMAEARERVPFEQSYSVAAYRAIQQGFIPDELEDPWFMFAEEEWLYIHANNGVGQCLYRLRFVRRDERWHVADAWASREESAPLPAENGFVARFARRYCEQLAQIGRDHFSTVRDGRPHPPDILSEPALSDWYILHYLIDHWLITRPWRPGRK